MGLSWWSSGQESACQCWGRGSTPGPGRSYMPWGNWARVSQLLARALEPVHCSERNHRQSGPHSPQPKKAQMQQWRPSTAKNKQIVKKKEIHLCLSATSRDSEFVPHSPLPLYCHSLFPLPTGNHQFVLLNWWVCLFFVIFTSLWYFF